MRVLVIYSVALLLGRRAAADDVKCDTDTTYDSDEGSIKPIHFSWLGTLQYIRVSDGTPHRFRQPRVLLVSRLFVLAAADDAAVVPAGYALGNVVFNLYERDEAECGVALAQLAAGKRCRPALLLAPVADALLHPEYKNFGVRHSLALLKMLRAVVSVYMLPVCLPLVDHVMRYGIPTKELLYHVDFTYDVPRDFGEEKDVSRVTVLPAELCRVLDPDVSGNASGTRLACTSGCGQRSGSALLTHERTGHWTLVGMSVGGTACTDPLRERRAPPAARHLLLLPYVPWITAAVSGVGASGKEDPFGYVVPLQEQKEDPNETTEKPRTAPGQRGHGWFGHWWMAGYRCFDRAPEALQLRRFYYEVFHVAVKATTYMTYKLNLASKQDDTIECVKVGSPFQLLRPYVTGVGTALVQVSVPIFQLEVSYTFHVEAWCISSNVSHSSSSWEYYYISE